MALTLAMAMGTKRSKAATTTAMSVRNTAGVAACSDPFRTENVVQVGTTVWTGMDPVLHGFEHRAVGFIVHVSEGRVVENTHAVIQYLVLWDVDVLPGVEDAGGNVFHNGGCDLTSGLVQDIGEVVFGEEGVSGISAVRIGPWFELVLARGGHDTRGPCLQRL